jgi:hypothetical protein
VRFVSIYKQRRQEKNLVYGEQSLKLSAGLISITLLTNWLISKKVLLCCIGSNMD